MPGQSELPATGQIWSFIRPVLMAAFGGSDVCGAGSESSANGNRVILVLGVGVAEAANLLG